MTPYYEDDFATLYNCDARAWILNGLSDRAVVLTGPPYFEDPTVAGVVMNAIRTPVVICQWNEFSKPPVELPLVAVHIWLNTDAQGLRYQPFYHFSEDGHRLRNSIMQYPTEPRTHPHDFPVELAQHLLLKTNPRMPVIDPFAGTGATLLAAKRLGRKAIGVEHDEARCKIAVERLRNEN